MEQVTSSNPFTDTGDFSQQQQSNGGSAFDTAAAQKAFRHILPHALNQQQQHGVEGMAADGNDGGPSDMAVDGAHGDGWLGWKAGGQPAAATAVQQGVLGFSLDPAVVARKQALGLAHSKPTQDAFEERAKAAPSGSRQRKSRYDYDPKMRRAEDILGAGPDAVYAGTDVEPDDTGMEGV